MVEKNVFGDIEYRLGEFFVPYRKGGTGKYVILKREPGKVVDPMWIPDGYWYNVPKFDSFIRAVRWLKENINDLVQKGKFMYMDEEGTMLASEILAEVKASAKRWFLAFCIMVLLEICTVGGFLWYISLPTEYDDIQIENEDGNANYIGHDLSGNLYNYGETE